MSTMSFGLAAHGVPMCSIPFSHDILEVYSPDEEFYPTDMPGEVEQVEVNQGIPRRNQM